MPLARTIDGGGDVNRTRDLFLMRETSYYWTTPLCFSVLAVLGQHTTIPLKALLVKTNTPKLLLDTRKNRDILR